jgi:hypothetical protein
MYKFVPQIYGSFENLGGDSEGKAIAGERSFLSMRLGERDREYCSRGCGRRERLGSKIIDDPTSVRGEGRTVWGR